MQSSGKLALLDQLLARLIGEGHRVLIFSQMVRMLDLLAEYLVLRGWSFQRLDGSTPTEARRKAIDAFNAAGSPNHCFLLSTRAGGLGLNLETADTVVLYDSDWNPQNDLQAMARAHRIGQTRPVRIFRLVSRGTIEETILERAKQKMVLDHLVIQSGQRGAVGREELQAILQFGAQALFSDTPPKEINVDLDEVMANGLAADGSEQCTAGLLAQFQVADFGDVAAWDDIIPETVREQMLQDAAEKEQHVRDVALQEALLTAASSRTKKARRQASGEEEGQPRRERKEKACSQSKANSKQEMPIDKTTTKRLVSQVLRYGRRVDCLQAACPELDEATILSVVESLNTAATACSAKSYTFGNGYYMSCQQLRERLSSLAQLTAILQPHQGNLGVFRIVERVKSVMAAGANRWTIPWTIVEDAKLLVGVWRHGWGEWMAIAEDKDLQLDRIKETLPEGKAGLPKALHLSRRVEFVIHSIIKEHEGELERPERSEAAQSRKPQNKPANSAACRPTSSERDPELKRIFRPFKGDLTFLDALAADELRTPEGLEAACERIHRLGDLISQHEPSSHEKLWVFVTEFWPTQIEQGELQNLYKRLKTKESKD